MKPGAKAELYLDGKPVGSVVLQSSNDSWHFGRFTPGEGFAEFAPWFARWALLMHEDEQLRLSEAASEELRQAEQDLVRIRAKLYYPEQQEWRRPVTLTIDGPLIEWKE